MYSVLNAAYVTTSLFFKIQQSKPPNKSGQIDKVPKRQVRSRTRIAPSWLGTQTLTSRARQVVRQMLKERMEGQKYDPVKGAQTAKQLADDMREKVKALGYDRYKYLVQVGANPLIPLKRDSYSAICYMR